MSGRPHLRASQGLERPSAGSAPIRPVPGPGLIGEPPLSQSSKQTSEPKHYAEIEAALVLFATQGESFELRRILARIDHPAATQAGELLAHGRPAGAEAVLEDALEAMAGPDNGAALEWFRPNAHRSARRSPNG